MELDELKIKWMEMDERLQKMEILNSRALEEVLRLKVMDHLQTLHRKSTVATTAGILLMLCLVPVLWSMPELSFESKLVLTVFLALTLVWQAYRDILLSKADIMMPTSQLMKVVLREKRAAMMDKFVGLPAILLTYLLFFFFERSWIIERGRVVPALILLAVLIFIAVSATLVNLRKYSALLQNIENELKELAE